jgi:hypothetical protein
MDDTLDPDIETRAFALEAAMWFYDTTGASPDSVGDVVNLAELFAHYLSQGQANEFLCSDSLRKTVRGL